MKNSKKIPPCLIGKPICRGCAGWEFMLNAQKKKIGLWAKMPIYCPIINLIKYPDI